MDQGLRLSWVEPVVLLTARAAGQRLTHPCPGKNFAQHPRRTPQWSDCRPRRLEAGVLRPARLAARGTALIRLEAVERRAHGNLVGIARPDDEIGYFFFGAGPAMLVHCNRAE